MTKAKQAAMIRDEVTTYVRLVPRTERQRSASQMSIPLRERLLQIAGISVTHIGSLEGVGGDSKQIRLSLLGSDLVQLSKLSAQAQEKIRAIPGVMIMSSLPLTLALMFFRSTLNLFSIIGFIMLMGLVTQNAILLVDFANQTRQAGKERAAALLEAAHVRLRPILMTTLAMVFGMVPLAFGMAEGSEQRAPMGQAVIGGVITSSLLTLVVVPVVYTYLDDFTAWAKRKWQGTQQTAELNQGSVAATVLQSKNDDIV